jgi:hypothetical protein
VIAKITTTITTEILQVPLYSIIYDDIEKAISLQLLRQPIVIIYFSLQIKKPPCSGLVLVGSTG